MRTLLRKVSSGLYFQGPDHWTTDPAEGLNFKSIDRALEFVRTYKLDGVEIAFAFKDSNNITTAPVEKLDVNYRQA
jgi:hypothetical protein